MIETTATVIMIVSERVGLHREEHALLLRNGYSVTEAQYGMDALLKLRDSRPDLIVLDLDMAVGRWLDICRDIRSETSAPILMLSARNTERDKVIALDSGIDDYVVKPFGVQELLARVRAALRRANSTAKPETSLIFESGDLKIDFDRRTVLVRGRGLPHAIAVTIAEITDRSGALQAFGRCKPNLGRVESVLVDGGYTGQPFADGVKQALNATVQVVKRNELHTFA